MHRCIVKIKRVHPHSSNPLPGYMTPHSSGMDLYAELDGDVLLQPGERMLVPSGIALEIPPGYEAQVRARSGLALRHGIALVNSPGTIDADYRGEVGVIIINHGNEPFPIRNGERIAQLVFAQFAQASLVEVVELEESVRGSGGFGHTGR